MSGLSPKLFAQVSLEFFRVLSNPNARIYVDAMETLAEEMGASALGISRQEAVETVLEILEESAVSLFPEDETTSAPELVPLRTQAIAILNRLIAASWLSEPQRNDFERRIYLERQGEIMLGALRQIASPEQATFTDKLQIACFSLMNAESFADDPWGQLSACIENVKQGLQELRGMQKNVEQMTKRQLAAQTLRENLAILYDEFSEAIGHACYRELVRVRLPVRVRQARRCLEQIEQDEILQGKMIREIIRRQHAEDPAAAASHARNRIHELFQLLDAIEPQAEEIDQRTADFARRSFARFHYLQEVGSARREQVQEFFEWINTNQAGNSLAGLDLPSQFPDMLIPEAGLIAGLESLFWPRRRRALGEMSPIDADPTDDELEACKREMETSLRESLTVVRANRFIESMNFEKVISSAELPLRNEDDLSDLIALLLHSEAADARYRVRAFREKDGGEAVPVDSKIGYRIERFEVEKK
jgi:hypothetical protein